MLTALALALLSQTPQHRLFYQPNLSRASAVSGCSIAFVSPNVVPTAGGETVTLTGPGLGSVTSVTIGGQSCTSVSASGTTVTCTAPALSSGLYDVVATRAADSCTASQGYSACDDTNNLLAGPGDMKGGELFGQAWWAPHGNGAAAPTVTSYYDTDPAGGNGGFRVQFAYVDAGTESTIYQRIPGDACAGVTCAYSIYLRSTPGGAGPSSGTLPIATAYDDNDGKQAQNCNFTSSWTRCELSFANPGSHSYFWIGRAAYGASYSDPGPAMDLELFGPKAELGDAGVYACTPYVTTLAVADWGIHNRDGAGLVSYADGTLLLTGGSWFETVPEWSNHVTTNDVYTSVNQGASWQQVLAYSDSPPQTNDAGARWRRRHSHGALLATFSGVEYAYVIGGDANDDYFGSSSGPYPQDVWRSADKGATWQVMTGDGGWGSRVLHQVWALDGGLYLAGGQTDLLTSSSALHDVWVSNDQGSTWARVTTDAGWLARGTDAWPVTLNGKVWLFGGEAYDNTNPRSRYNDVWVWDGGNGGGWTRVQADAGWIARGYPSTNLFDGKFWVSRGNYGDSNTQDTNDLWWSTDGLAWSRNQWSSGTIDTHAGSNAVSNGALVIAGGDFTDGGVWRVQKGPVMW